MSVGVRLVLTEKVTLRTSSQLPPNNVYGRCTAALAQYRTRRFYILGLRDDLKFASLSIGRGELIYLYMYEYVHCTVHCTVFSLVDRVEENEGDTTRRNILVIISASGADAINSSSAAKRQ